MKKEMLELSAGQRPSYQSYALVVTQQQEENLRKLAVHLFANVVKSNFSMADYFKYKNDQGFECIATERTTPIKPHMYNECGTIACAAGHGPELGGSLKNLPTERWRDYVARVFGANDNGALWPYLFSGIWKAYDDSPQGAAKRIFSVLRTRWIPGFYRLRDSDRISELLDYQKRATFEYILPTTEKYIPFQIIEVQSPNRESFKAFVWGEYGKETIRGVTKYRYLVERI